MPEPTFKDVREMDEGEFRVHLCNLMGDGHHRMNSMEKTIRRHDEAITAIHERCAARRWQGRVLWAALLGIVGLVLERVVSGLWSKP